MGLFKSIKKGLFGGKTKKAQTNVTKNEVVEEAPWSPVAAPLQNYVNDTTALYNNTPLFSDEELAARAQAQAVNNSAINAPLFSPEELEANARFIAGNRDAINDLQYAIDENNKTLRGEYLSPDTNPYLADIAKRVSGTAGASASATFGGRGRTSGGLSAMYHGKAVGDSLTDLYGKNYENERGRMSTAVGYSPTLATTKSGLYGNEVTLGEKISNRPIERAAANQPFVTSNLQLGLDATNRPLERNAMQGGVLSEIAKLGGTKTGATTGTESVYGKSSGLLGSIFNAAANKVFGTSFRTN